jgi:hypothetical protein
VIVVFGTGVGVGVEGVAVGVGDAHPATIIAAISIMVATIIIVRAFL